VSEHNLHENFTPAHHSTILLLFMIFVQIAAYRAPELLPTIRDCLAKADFPDDLRFGICWQTDAEDRSLDSVLGSDRFRIQRVPWHENRGLCWARSEIQKLYGGEEFTLQLDSHHRFEQGWDRFLLESFENCGSAKPILTSYAGVYEPGKSETPSSGPFKMVADRFTPSGTILFHPHRNVIWHEYTRAGRTKHWDDHTRKQAEAPIEKPWHERDTLSKRRLRKMLREEENDEDIGIYGLGTVRSHADYERYAGIDFGRRLLQRETVEGSEPPCTYRDESQWEAGFLHEYRLPLKWRASSIERCDDLQFVYFGVEDTCGEVLYRHDAPAHSPEANGQVE